jgi:5,10-methylenetetrahydromethanopterin reductase
MTEKNIPPRNQPRFALYMQDKHLLGYELEMAEYAEAHGFSEIWQADTRLARDCIVMMSAFLTRTKKLRLGSGVLPIWTRNAAVIAASWSTMWELGKQTSGDPDAPSRVMLGLGAWWEPIASRVGEKRERPLHAMRENVEAIRQLFAMNEVTYQGEFVKLDRVKLDVVFGDTRPRDIPIYIGATGDKMLELAGEICDGVVLNYVVSVDYIRKAVELVTKGAAKSGRTIAQVDRPELLVCALSDENPKAAMAEAKKLVAYYLATEPHIMKASGVPDDLIKKVQAVMTWPASEAEYIAASKVIPDDVPRLLMAVGTSDECMAKIREYIAAGVTCPILYPLMDDIKPVVDAVAASKW